MTSEAISFFPDSLTDTKGIGADAPSTAFPGVGRSETQSSAVMGSTDDVAQHATDENLLLHAGNGNKEALSLLFGRHRRAIFHVAQRILKDDSEAEDLLQELFLFVFQKAKAFNPAKGTAASWIIQMTYHRAIDRRRYLQFRHHYKEHMPADDQFVAQASSNLADKLDVQALLKNLREELSPEQRQVLELHFFEGYSFREIAEKTGQNYGNIRNHYYRAIQRLREHVVQGKAIAK